MRAKAAATMGAAAADSDEASAASSGAGTILESEEIQSIVSAMQRKRQGLRDPVNLTINSVANVEVEDAGGEHTSLLRYMRLPVEQYTSDVLAGGQISRVHGTNNLFVLAVPKLQLFDVWLKPEMKVVVEPPSEANRCVRLVALECTVTGSPFIENLGFNELFVVSMETQLEHMQSDRQLQARAQLSVWTEVVAPFNLIPRSLLVATCNGVVRTVMNTMLTIFATKLVKDYQRWAADDAYRLERSRSSPSSVDLP